MDKTKGKDNHVFCWSCGKKTMQPYKDWHKCSNCGATHVDLPNPGHLAFSVVDNPAAGETRGKPWGAPD